MNIRNLFMVLLIGMLMASCSTQSQENKDNMEQKPVAGTDGNKYVPATSMCPTISAQATRPWSISPAT